MHIEGGNNLSNQCARSNQFGVIGKEVVYVDHTVSHMFGIKGIHSENWVSH